jgi:hypothetical protein
MNHSSTILTVGTALRHAQDGAARVHVLLGGTWMTGSVIGVDGEGAVLESDNGDTTVVRMQAITAVRVEELGKQKRRPKPAPAWHEDGPDLSAERIYDPEEFLTRDIAEYHREPQPA